MKKLRISITENDEFVIQKRCLLFFWMDASLHEDGDIYGPILDFFYFCFDSEDYCMATPKYYENLAEAVERVNEYHAFLMPANKKKKIRTPIAIGHIEQAKCYDELNELKNDSLISKNK